MISLQASVTNTQCPARLPLTLFWRGRILELMQRSSNKAAHKATLLDLAPGEEATLLKLDLPEDIAHRLMILGFVPGSTVSYTRSAPGGDPRVYRVAGADVALRRETARHIHLDQSL